MRATWHRSLDAAAMYKSVRRVKRVVIPAHWRSIVSRLVVRWAALQRMPLPGALRTRVGDDVGGKPQSWLHSIFKEYRNFH